MSIAALQWRTQSVSQTYIASLAYHLLPLKLILLPLLSSFPLTFSVLFQYTRSFWWHRLLQDFQNSIFFNMRTIWLSNIFSSAFILTWCRFFERTGFLLMDLSGVPASFCKAQRHRLGGRGRYCWIWVFFEIYLLLGWGNEVNSDTAEIFLKPPGYKTLHLMTFLMGPFVVTSPSNLTLILPHIFILSRWFVFNNTYYEEGC